MITSATIICSFVAPMIYLQNCPNDCCNSNNPFLISDSDSLILLLLLMGRNYNIHMYGHYISQIFLHYMLDLISLCLSHGFRRIHSV
jgi:hypothetical protein